MHTKHDHSYRHLFARPQLIESLVREFVPEPWVDDLDFSTLERVNASYVSHRLKRSEGDMVWKLRRRDGAPVYIYLLVEFQSRTERFMAVRLMSYVAALYLDLIARKELAPGRRLPLVIPLVVYNGHSRWRAPRQLSALIEPVEPAAEAYVPQLLYRVIDQGAYTPEDLEERKGLTALLFWLKAQGTRGPRRVHSRLRKLLARENDPALYRAVLAWIYAETEQDPRSIPESLTLEEFSDMWAKTFERFEREAREEGWKDGKRVGKKEGTAEGKKKGEATLLLRLLERKFGPLDRQTRARIGKADSKHLLEWGERILAAERLEQVFEG
jgi:predicted transposase YdaD